MQLKRFLMLMVFFCTASIAVSQNGQQEANLKAAFIYNFTSYIDWANNEGEDFVIGVIGPSDVIQPLNVIAQTNTVQSKRIVIRNFTKLNEIQDCNILFIPSNSSFSLQSILDKTGRGVLTISEEPGFAKQGTALNFVIINDKLKFEANLKALYQAGLKASSQLLKLAKIVD
jgi:hypothetical protein